MTNTLKNRLIYIGLLLLVTFFTYSPALKAKLTNWDDDGYITKNKDITSVKKYGADLVTKTYEGNYHPLTMLSYALDYSLGKLKPKTYHRTNLILHLANVVLVFWLITVLVNNLEVGLMVALLFGVHPMNVESVAWVSERKNVLYTFFFLASVLAYIFYLKKERMALYGIALVLFVLSLFSKGMAVSLSVTLLGIDYLMDRNLGSKKVWIEKIPFFLLSLVFGWLALRAQPIGLEEIELGRGGPQANPLYEKCLYALHNLGAYVAKLLVPLDLAVFYPYPEKAERILPWQFYLVPLLVVMGLGYVVGVLWKKKSTFSKLALFGVFFFVANIFLVLQLIPVGDALMADRYVYVPSIGLFLCIGAAYLHFLSSVPQRAYWMGAGLGILGFSFSYLAYERCKVWKDSITLWTDQLEKYPDLGFAYNQRGLAKEGAGDQNGALQDYSASLQADPLFYKAYNNRAILTSYNGQFQAALKDFDKALSINKNYLDVYENRGRVKYMAGDYAGALQDFEKYNTFKPDNANVYLLMGVTHLAVKQYKLALGDYNKVIALDPKNLEAYSNRAVVRSMLNDLPGAMADFNRLIEIDPTYNVGYYNRGKTYLALENNALACKDFNMAAVYGHPDAKNMLTQFCR